MSALAGGRKEEKGKNIQVVVRCRPFNTAERKSASYGVLDCDQHRKEVTVKTGGVTDKSARKTYTFDMVFGPSAKQIEVYRSVLCPILDEVMLGYNCTVFAYGQTGTGKTFTMEGERSTDEEYTWEEDPLAGIIPRTLHQIFEKLSDNNTEFSVKVSLLEIYNEELFDLLSPSPDVTERLQMFDDPRNKRGVVIKGLEEITVHNKDEVYQILERGAAKRKTASTLMNAYSSRSHSVFSVIIHMKEVNLEGEELVKIGKLNLVDLAGSENIGRSGAVDKRAREAGNINQSLLTLGRVITALVERRPHVPYRESKLTRILQDSLGGRTKTSIIATVSPASINLEETLSTLDYANRAKSIMNKPEVNQKLTKRMLIKEYTEEIERLKRDLAATRDKHGVYLSSENYESMNSKLMEQELQMTESIEKIAALEEELRKVQDLFSDSKEQVEALGVELEETRGYLQGALQDLQETLLKLRQEAFITSRLRSAEENLHSAANQLLTVADVSTTDVGGLHAKLDRSREVERHNSGAQQRFGQQMENSYQLLQNSLQQQRGAQEAFLEHCSASIGELQRCSARALEDTIRSLQDYKSGVKALVGEAVGSCVLKLNKQHDLNSQTRDALLAILKEHEEDLTSVLTSQALPNVASLVSIMGSLTHTLDSQRALVQRMGVMKGQVMSHLELQASGLAELRGAAMMGFQALKDDITNLNQRLDTARHAHKANLSQVLECIQGQMSLLGENTQSSFEELQTHTVALVTPVDTLEHTLHSKCSEAEELELACHKAFDATATSLVSESNRVTSDLASTLEESSGYQRHLQVCLEELQERSSTWSLKTREQVEAAAQKHSHLTQATQDALQAMEQPMETQGAVLLQATRGNLEQHHDVACRGLTDLQQRAEEDVKTLQCTTVDVETHATHTQHTLQTFLHHELRKDTPTGTTPQRKEYVYPRELLRARERDELIEEFNAQMEALREESDTPNKEEEEEQESTDDQGSAKDEVESSEGSMMAELSACEDMNIMCDENSRGPFFKQKRSTRKKAKSQICPKQPEVDLANATRSKLPLRCQN